MQNPGPFWAQTNTVSIPRLQSQSIISAEMKPSDALRQHRDAICATVRRHRVANPRVFGSTALAQDHEGSDLDLLVDPLPQTTLFDLGALQVELEELLGVRVDVRVPRDLPVKVRLRVLAQAHAI